MRMPRRIALPTAALAALAAVALLAGCSNSEQDSTASNSADSTAAGQSGSTADSSAAEAVALNVFAASSTRVLNDELKAAAAGLATPATLTFSNGGSSELVQQIKDGAPADLLLTASKKTMDQAVADGTVEPPVTLATNVMVMVVPKGNPGDIHSVEDLTDDKTVVLCDPTVPCGDVSAHIIEEKGLKVNADSLESQVADVVGKVSSGEADAGWVYSTDAAAAGDSVEVIEIPGSEEHTNRILGAVTKETQNKEAAQGVLDLLADDFDTTWKEYGFTPAD